MEQDEEIHAHVLSVWRESRKTLSIGGKEGMLILTDKHVVFIHKTVAKIKWWQAVSKRQILSLLKENNIMKIQDGYDSKNLMIDLENKKNTEIRFDNILKIENKEKVWGSVLELDYLENGNTMKYRFAIAQDWVKYPIKEPTKYMKIDWTPFVEMVESRRNIKE